MNRADRMMRLQNSLDLASLWTKLCGRSECRGIGLPE
jgi:hypothetical protein